MQTNIERGSPYRERIVALSCDNLKLLTEQHVQRRPFLSAQVHKGVMVSTKLPTLRDMIENTHVDPSSFEIAEEIGAGAFATG